jgi:hypothetical protein
MTSFRLLLAAWAALLAVDMATATEGDWEHLAPAADPVAVLTRIFAPAKQASVPEPPEPRGYCGLEIEALVAQSWSRLSPALQSAIPDHYRPRHLRQLSLQAGAGLDVCDAWQDSDHFRIHYSTQPGHQPPGYPDLGTVTDLAAHLETSYAYHRDVSGMGVAQPDSAYGGGLDLIDCYFYDLERNVLGFASTMDWAAGGCEWAAWGLIAINTDLSPLDFDSQLRLTPEHEYYHLLQFARDPRQSTWFVESTARNSEFHVWPELAQPRGILDWMQHPYEAIWDAGSGLRHYAPHLWFYLEAHFGYDFTTRVWDRCCLQMSTEALAAELAAQGTDLDRILADFAVWNYFTGERNDGRHYGPAYGLPAVYYQAAQHAYPVAPRIITGDRVARASGSNYVRFDGPARHSGLRLTVDGEPELAGRRVVTVLAVNDWGHQAWTLTPDANGDVEFVVPDWGLYGHVALVVTNFWDAPRDSAALYYTYAAEEVEAAVNLGDSLHLVSSAPNPFGQATRITYFAPVSGPLVTIRVYDPAGRLVRTLIDEPAYAGHHQVTWDGLDRHGRRAATGMYLVRLEDGSRQQARKVVFVR